MDSKMIKFSALVLMVLSCLAVAEFNPFATKVIDISLNSPYEPNYLPAPGQFINHPDFNKAYRALGAPIYLGWSVSLGGFGGKIALSFDHDVQNNPANPMGLDAIVFSNAWFCYPFQNLHYRFGELATIEIMPELNDNNTPGDAPGEKWFLIPGSHLSSPNDYRTRLWDRYDPTLFGYPVYQWQTGFFQGWPDTYETGGFELFPNYQNIGTPEEPLWLLVNPNYIGGDPGSVTLEGYWGYAEYTPTMPLGDINADFTVEWPDMPPELFYTVPDDPFTVGITPGSGGGDAFDISWAVDPCTFEPANLSSFRYIRITTAVDNRELGDEGMLGEVSSEIAGVSDVRPYGDLDGYGEVDLADLEIFIQAWLSQWPEPEFNPAADFIADNKIDLKDYAKLAQGFVGN